MIIKKSIEKRNEGFLIISVRILRSGSVKFDINEALQSYKRPKNIAEIKDQIIKRVKNKWMNKKNEKQKNVQDIIYKKDHDF